MTFLAPALLAGTAAAGIPIALHFFYRSRYRRVPWAAMRFLRTSIEQTSRRLRFQELVLLILRVLVLVLVALALARPTSAPTASAGAARGESVDAVFVFDTSFSMAARDGEMTRLDRAKAAALAVMDQLPARSTVQVVAGSDRAALLGPRVPGNLEAARQLIGELQVQHLATDFLPAAGEALAVVERGNSPAREVYLFSDMQRLGWDRQPVALRAALADVQRQAGVYLVRCGGRPVRNVSLTALAPQAGVPHTGNRTSFAALVRNGSGEPVRDLTVTLENEGRPLDKDAKPLAAVAPGETQAVTLTGKIDKAGLRALTARVQPDDLEVDNRFDRVVQVRDQIRVLVVDGSPNDRDPEKASTFFLMHALLPVPEAGRATYPVQPRVVPPARAAGALLDGKDVCVLSDVNADDLPPGFIDRLAVFVREGHGLIVAAGPKAAAGRGSAALGPRGANLLPTELGPPFAAPADKPFHPDPASAAGQSFLAPFREPPLDAVGKVEVKQGVDLKPPDRTDAAVRVLLKLNDGRPLLASRSVGDGEVLLLATGFDGASSDWPTARPTFLPFVQGMLAQLVQRPTQHLNRVAGEALRFTAPDPDAAYVLVKPDGQRVPLTRPKGARADDPLTVSGADTTRAGVYRIQPDAPTARERDSAVYAVVPDPREAESLEALAEADIDTLLGFKPVHLNAGELVAGGAGGDRLRREWTVEVLLAVLLLAAAESAWAWFCGRAW